MADPILGSGDLLPQLYSAGLRAQAFAEPLLIEGDKPATWPSGSGITDLIGRALCVGHPPLADQPRLEGRT
jgi:hypothetical protein